MNRKRIYLEHQIGPDISSSHVPAEFRQILLPCRDVVMKPAGSSSPGGLRSFQHLKIPRTVRQKRKRRSPWEAASRFSSEDGPVGGAGKERTLRPYPSALHFIQSEAAPMECRSAQAHAVPEITRHRITSFRLLIMTNPMWGDLCHVARGFVFKRKRKTSKRKRGAAAPSSPISAPGADILLRPCSGHHLLVLAVGDEILDDGRVGQRRSVAQCPEIVFGDLAQDAAHDLARSGLRQARRELDLVG
jgi:hypothetical protein